MQVQRHIDAGSERCWYRFVKMFL